MDGIGRGLAHIPKAFWYTAAQANSDSGNDVAAKSCETAWLIFAFCSRSSEIVAQGTGIPQFLQFMRDWVDVSEGFGFLRYLTCFEASKFVNAMPAGQSFWHDITHFDQRGEGVLCKSLFGLDGLLALLSMASRAELAMGSQKVFAWGQSSSVNHLRSVLLGSAAVIDGQCAGQRLWKAYRQGEGIEAKDCWTLAARIASLGLVLNTELGGSKFLGSAAATLLALKVIDTLCSIATQYLGKSQAPSGASDRNLSVAVTPSLPHRSKEGYLAEGSLGGPSGDVRANIVPTGFPRALKRLLSPLPWLAQASFANGLKTRQKSLSLMSNVVKLLELTAVLDSQWTGSLHAVSNAVSAWRKLCKIFDTTLWRELGNSGSVRGYLVKVLKDLPPILVALSGLSQGVVYVRKLLPQTGRQVSGGLGSLGIWCQVCDLFSDFSALSLAITGVLAWKKCYQGCPQGSESLQKMSLGQLRLLSRMTEVEMEHVDVYLAGLDEEDSLKALLTNWDDRRYLSPYTLGAAEREKRFQCWQAFLNGLGLLSKAAVIGGKSRLADKKWGQIVLAGAGAVSAGSLLLAAWHKSWHQNHGKQSVLYARYERPYLAASAA